MQGGSILLLGLWHSYQVQIQVWARISLILLSIWIRGSPSYHPLSSQHMTDVNVLSSGGDALVQTFTPSRDHCELHLRGLGTGSLEPVATQLHHCSSKVASRCVAGKR